MLLNYTRAAAGTTFWSVIHTNHSRPGFSQDQSLFGRMELWSLAPASLRACRSRRRPEGPWNFRDHRPYSQLPHTGEIKPF